jgi:hypothetical protein
MQDLKLSQQLNKMTFSLAIGHVRMAQYNISTTLSASIMRVDISPDYSRDSDLQHHSSQTIIQNGFIKWP